DVTKMPNGNLLFVVWDKKNTQEAIAAGRKKDLVSNYVLPDSIVEVKPTGKTTGEVVWEWHLWDHLIQDQDSTKANYGKVADHPERIDINFGGDTLDHVFGKKDSAKMKDTFGVPQSDWTHFNSLAYNAELDQVMISVHGFSEFW